MKKKLLPFILGCAMIAAMPLAAHAENSAGTTLWSGNEIPTTGTSPNAGDDGQNEFTEYNSDATSTQNQRVYTYGTPSVAGDNTVTWGAATLGNTRNTTATTQSSYPVAMKNEKASTTYGTLAEDLASNDFKQNDNDYAYDDATSAYVDRTDTGRTDLETAVPEFVMEIPASTVLPMGATLWRIGNVKINGKYFVRPDKVQLRVDKQNFRHEDYDTSKAESDTANVPMVIPFDILDQSAGSSIVYVDTTTPNYTYFFQDGTGHLNANFPHTYTEYTSADYEDGFISEINETHQVWVKPANGAWTGKTAGKYSGSVTFTASVVTTEDSGMYGDRTAQDNPYYPGEAALS